jgi:hypothetical protein
MFPLYKDKSNRDIAFKAAGGASAGLKKTSVRNQQLHPGYVADSGMAHATGLNGDYQTTFAVLYSFERKR